MQTTQGVRLESLRAVQQFIATNADRLPTVVETGLYRRLNSAIEVLSTYVRVQGGSHLLAMGMTQRQYQLRRALVRNHLKPIVCIAKVELQDEPALESFRLLRGKPTSQRLAIHARGIALAATPFAHIFVAAGLPEDFIARMEAATDALLASRSDRWQKVGERVGATLGVELQLRRSRLLVDALGALIESSLGDDDALLASWRAAKPVRHVGSRTTSAISPGNDQSASGSLSAVAGLRLLGAPPFAADQPTASDLTSEESAVDQP